MKIPYPYQDYPPRWGVFEQHVPMFDAEAFGFMDKRDIPKELFQGLEEIKAWKRGEVKLKNFTVKAAMQAILKPAKSHKG